MQLDAHGNALCGVSGSGVWMNGAPQQPGPSGWPQFWPVGGYLYNHQVSPNVFNIETGNGQLLSMTGGAPLYAGGGVWLAALLGGTPTATRGALRARAPRVSPKHIFTTIGPYQ
jgi:hypothetical protein